MFHLSKALTTYNNPSVVTDLSSLGFSLIYTPSPQSPLLGQKSLSLSCFFIVWFDLASLAFCREGVRITVTNVGEKGVRGSRRREEPSSGERGRECSNTPFHVSLCSSTFPRKS